VQATVVLFGVPFYAIMASFFFCTLYLSLHFWKLNIKAVCLLHMQVEGRRRFRILESWDQDGWVSVLSTSLSGSIFINKQDTYHELHDWLVLCMNFNFVYNWCRYRVAQVEWIEDIQPPQGSPESEDVSLMLFFAICMLVVLNIGGTNI